MNVFPFNFGVIDQYLTTYRYLGTILVQKCHIKFYFWNEIQMIKFKYYLMLHDRFPCKFWTN